VSFADIPSMNELGMKLLTLFARRIYKPKYMDDTSADKRKDASKQQHPAPPPPPESPVPGGKPAGRSRARSIWGRKKEK
jgi:hypothetical protein